jgi:hypothetical protein
LQNATGTKKIVGNRVWENYGKGIQLYGSDTAKINGFVVTGNVVSDNGVIPGVISDPQNNLVVQGPTANDVTISDNWFSYRKDGHEPSYGVDIGPVGGAFVFSENVCNDNVRIAQSLAPCPVLSGNLMLRNVAGPYATALQAGS